MFAPQERENMKQFDWSWADALMKKTEPRWEVLKEAGNESFKSGQFDQAEKLYQDALYITLQPMPQIKTLIIFGKNNPDSALARFIDANLQSLLLDFLPPWIVQDRKESTKERMNLDSNITVSFPNKAAAICYSNMAAVQLKRGSGKSKEEGLTHDYERALHNVNKAIKCCPSYVKARSRKAEALRRVASLTPTTATSSKKEQLKEAKTIIRHVEAFNLMDGMMASDAQCMLQLGWIDPVLFLSYYQVARWFAAMRSIHEKFQDIEDVQVQVSLVPFMQYPWMTLAVSFLPRNEFQRVRYDCLHFQVVDKKEGVDRIESPPHGHSSKQACMNSLGHTLDCLERLIDEEKLVVESVKLGQALMMHFDDFQKGIDETINKKYEGKYKPVKVVKSISTHASEMAARSSGFF